MAKKQKASLRAPLETHSLRSSEISGCLNTPKVKHLRP